MAKYPFESIEPKWQAYWEKNKTFKVTEDTKFEPAKRRYVLDMFPYPSAQGLHVGHPEGYTATDIYCRYLRMNGYNVLHPMGYDAFGLPAENYAIKTGTHPATTTNANIDHFTQQIKALGFSYDWDRCVSTCTPDYYHWTQWIFLQLYKKGLAYEAETPINWCPSCLTGLANEEVKEGRCDRCGTAVTRKTIRQWILKITAYAERLLEDLEGLDWPESVKLMQRNWIGKSEGGEVSFKIADAEGNPSDQELLIYTTRADTLYGATYMVVAPEHKLVPSLTTAEQKSAVEAYVEAAAKKSDLERTDLAKEKTGVFTGSYAINPVNGAKIPSSYLAWAGGAIVLFAVLTFAYVSLRYRWNMGLIAALSTLVGGVFAAAIILLVRVPVTSTVLSVVAVSAMLSTVMTLLVLNKLRSNLQSEEFADKSAEETVVESYPCKEIFALVSILGVAIVVVGAISRLNVFFFALTSLIGLVCATVVGAGIMPASCILMLERMKKVAAETNKSGYVGAKKNADEE